MGRGTFGWISVSAFKRLTPMAKEAYLREVVTHLADQLVDEARSKPRLRAAKTPSRKRA